jgi:hypothetical protein
VQPAGRVHHGLQFLQQQQQQQQQQRQVSIIRAADATRSKQSMLVPCHCSRHITSCSSTPLSVRGYSSTTGPCIDPSAAVYLQVYGLECCHFFWVWLHTHISLHNSNNSKDKQVSHTYSQHFANQACSHSWECPG